MSNKSYIKSNTNYLENLTSQLNSREEMVCRPEYARLCRLINDSLCSFAVEPQQMQVTKDSEKDLLIILSQISGEIGEWEDGQETDSDSDHDGEQQYLGDSDFHECLPEIVCLLVTFLTNESQYVRHSTSNILVGVSNFIAKLSCEWDKFLHILCVCLEVSMSTTISATSGSSIIDSTKSGDDSSRHVRKMMVNVNWNTVAGLVRTLRTILKNLKQCPDGELLKFFIKSVDACLTNIPWECMDGIPIVQSSDSQIRSGNDLFCHGKVGSPVSRFVFLGALLQLLCSLIHVITSVEVSTSDNHLVLGKMTKLVPKLLYWCSHQQDQSNRMCSSHYLRHKILMLMIRLSFLVHQGTSFFVLWLQLLHEYFEDILHQPITGRHTGLDDCLEGSPFLSCFTDRQANHRMSNRHLQRQANFLFLKCSVGLISLGKETATNCLCASSNSCLTIQLESDQECCTWKKGSVELSGWLKRHVPLETLVDHGMYLEKCGHFALSFLQLYMDEDDFLFDVLLQLSSLPFPLEQKDFKENDKGFDNLKGDIGFHLNKVFDPVHLFHLFLAELRYDHLVLLDYLISKDAGIHCLQYLLRCLRTLRSSWNLLVEVPGFMGERKEKKRKFSACGSDSDETIQISFTPRKEQKSPGVLDDECKAKGVYIGMLEDTRNYNFQSAKGCLLSLKTSVENLHQKNLFPYNPAALLRSLTSFQELCHQQENV